MWQWLLAASPDPSALSQYGLAGIVIAALSVAVLRLWSEVQRLNAAALAREREMNEKTIPVLAETVRVMALVPPAMDRSLAQAEDSTRSSQIRRTVEQVLREQSPPNR